MSCKLFLLKGQLHSVVIEYTVYIVITARYLDLIEQINCTLLPLSMSMERLFK